MLSYEDIKHKPKTLMAMTSLSRSEFEGLLGDFAKAWGDETGRERMDPSKGGRPPTIQSLANRLLFILFYLKTYPLPEAIAHLFGLSQSQANFTIHPLSAVLGKALDAQGHQPARLTEEMLARLEEELPQDLGLVQHSFCKFPARWFGGLAEDRNRWGLRETSSGCFYPSP